MPKKNGFIAISLIYSFFLCFIMLMMGLLLNYTQSKLILDKINKPLEYNPEYPYLVDKIKQDYDENNDSSVHNFDYPSPCNVSYCPESKSGLFSQTDDKGISYYFRGKIENNYVSFANRTWRIVRINGDGTIRIILTENIGTKQFNENLDDDKYVGYTYDNDHICIKNNHCLTNSGTSSKVKEELEKWYDENLSDYDNYIALASFCNDTSIFKQSGDSIQYSGYQRITIDGRPNLTCSDTTVDYGGYYLLKIGLLTIDEAVLAGIADGKINNNFSAVALENYLKESAQGYKMTPYTTNSSNNSIYIYIGNTSKVATGLHVNNNFEIFPVINLKADVKVSGNGTVNNPYIIK